MSISDLQVELHSSALAGKTIDVVVSGSIGAVEAVRFLRALRRLGATTVPWLTAGGSQFTTPTALAWAADHPVRQSFSGTESHLAEADACVVAPASANFIYGLATGQTHSAALAVVASHLGQRNPVLVLPNMHDSLGQAPAVQRNLQALKTIGEDGCQILGARSEEGKQKFPAPEVLAGQVAHAVNRRDDQTLLTMGTTRGYIDDVRYLSNYSSGALGSAIAEELYYRGIQTHVICGPCPIRPRFATQIIDVQTTEEMQSAVAKSIGAANHAAIFAASVLDYVPTERQSGKIRSQEKSLTITCEPTPKIIAVHADKSQFKVGFKLEPDLTEEGALEIAARYQQKYQLSHMVLNALGDVSPSRHKAFIIDCQTRDVAVADGKRATAIALVDHLMH